jgi:hypothetical protein
MIPAIEGEAAEVPPMIEADSSEMLPSLFVDHWHEPS